MFKQGIFALQNPGSHNWTVERTWRDAGAWFRWARKLLPREAVSGFSISDLRLELVNGGVWEFRSADRPATLRGEGLHSLVGHEVAFWSVESWHALRPALSDKQGWAVLNSTPIGLQNWFACEWTNALGSVSTEWESSRVALRWPTSFSHLVSKADIDDAKRTMPDAMFRQEYLGEFVSDAGSLFRINPKVWTGSFELPQPTGRYVAGFDLAKRRDWMAWGILRIDCVPHRLVSFGRMQQVEYITQTAFLEKKFKHYNVKLALGDMYQETVLELLQSKGVKAEGFSLTGVSRPTILTDLSVALEQGDIRIPVEGDSNQKQDITVLKAEFENFTPQVSKSGSIRYEAARGYNDDFVFMLAMALQASKQQVKQNEAGAGFIVTSRR